MRLLFFFFLIFATPVIAFSQTPEIQKAIKEIKDQIADIDKQIVAAKRDNPESVKELQDQKNDLTKQLTMMEGLGKSLGNMNVSAMADGNGSTAICMPGDGFPERKTSLINALPKKTLTKTEIISFITTLHNDLKRKYAGGPVQHFQEILGQVHNVTDRIAFAGVGAWYNNAPEESILLLTYASMKEPNDIVLNNCGAIMNLLCMEEKAIPILEYVLPKEPHNCTLLNNIGQAFAGLGEKDSAMKYFNQVFEKCSGHPDANATAAYIAYARGDQEKAADYMRRALAGAFSQQRWDFLKAIKPDEEPNVDPDKVNPEGNEYFKPNGFTPAPNCKSWDQCEPVTRLQEAVKKKAQEITDQSSRDVQDNSLIKILEDPVEKANWDKGIGWTPGPFAQKAYYLMQGLAKKLVDPKGDALVDLTNQIYQLNNVTNVAITALDAKYELLSKACYNSSNPSPCFDKVSYDHCMERKALDNNYFSHLAALADQYESVWYPKDVKYYNSMVYLRPFVSPNARVRKSEIAIFNLNLANEIVAYSLSTCSCEGKPVCMPPPPASQDPQLNPLFIDGKCPIDVKIPFGVGSVSLNCDRFGFEVGEGVTFRYEKDFNSKETTLAIGLGANANIPGIDAGAGVEVAIKFDANNQPCDLIGSAQAGVGITGMSSQLVSVGASVGINSSFTPTFSALGN